MGKLALTTDESNLIDCHLKMAADLSNLTRDVPQDYRDLIWGMAQDIRTLSFKINRFAQRLDAE